MCWFTQTSGLMVDLVLPGCHNLGFSLCPTVQLVLLKVISRVYSKLPTIIWLFAFSDNTTSRAIEYEFVPSACYQNSA